MPPDDEIINGNTSDLYYKILVDQGNLYKSYDYGFEFKYPDNLFYFDLCWPRGNELLRLCVESFDSDVAGSNIEILIYENEYINEEEFLSQEVQNNKFISSVLPVDNKEKIESRIIDFADKRWVESWGYHNDYLGEYGVTELRTMHKDYIYVLSYAALGDLNMIQEPINDNVKVGLAIFKQMLHEFKYIETIDVSDWQAYEYEEYGFEIRIPNRLMSIGIIPELYSDYESPNFFVDRTLYLGSDKFVDSSGKFVNPSNYEIMPAYFIYMYVKENPYDSEEEYFKEEIMRTEIDRNDLDICDWHAKVVLGETRCLPEFPKRIIDFADKQWLELYGLTRGTDLYIPHGKWVYQFGIEIAGSLIESDSYINMDSVLIDPTEKIGFELFKQILSSFKFID